MMTDSLQRLRLAELLAARLCHDLAGPLGTAAGLLELAEETGDRAALADARTATARVANRLRMSRAAWAADPASLRKEELVALTADISADGRVSLDFSALLREHCFSPTAGRIVLNLLLLGVEALRGSGTVHISGAAGQDVMLRIVGPHAAWPAGMAACLVEPETAWDHLTEGRALQMPITILLAAQAGHRLSMLMPVGPGSAAPPPLLLDLR